MRAATSADPVEDVSAELVTLIRGLRELHVAIVEFGAHRIEVSALTLLARLSELAPARLSSLAGAMCLDLSTVSRQVPALERAGWVVRAQDPDDRRAQLLDLSPSGHAMLEEIRRSRAQVLARILPDWSADELRAFAAQLARFNRAVTSRRSDALAVAAAADPDPQESA